MRTQNTMKFKIQAEGLEYYFHWLKLICKINSLIWGGDGNAGADAAVLSST